MDSDRDAMEGTYRQRADQFAATWRHYAHREPLLMNLRVATFVIAIVMFFVGWKSASGWPWHLAGGFAIGGFFAAVTYHEYVRRQMRRYFVWHEINKQAVARLRREWKSLPETPATVPPQHSAVALDLDLFGHGSLFQLLCLANTPMGIQTLRNWFLEPASPGEIKRRQQAVAELAPHLELRQTLIVEGRLLGDRGRTLERFIEWAQSGPWLTARSWLLWPVRILTAAALLISVLTCCGVIAADLGGLAFLIVVFVNVNVVVLFGGKVYGIFSIFSLRRGEIRRYLRMFGLMYSMPNSSAELDALKREATTVGGGVLLRMRN